MQRYHEERDQNAQDLETERCTTTQLRRERNDLQQHLKETRENLHEVEGTCERLRRERTEAQGAAESLRSEAARLRDERNKAQATMKEMEAEFCTGEVRLLRGLRPTHRGRRRRVHWGHHRTTSVPAKRS